jgi:aspartate aminotransferase
MAQKFLSERVNQMQESPTLALNAKAKALQAAGHPVINLTVGEPDFDTPEFVKEAGIAAIRANKTRYTDAKGTPSLRAAISEKFKRDNNLTYDANKQVIVSTGGKQVIFNALAAVINPGDEVVIASPYWVSYPPMVSFFGGVPRIVETTEENGFRMSYDQLKDSVTPKTKLVIMNTVINPTGEVYLREQLESLGRVGKDNPHVLWLSDDIYEPLVFDGAKFTTVAEAVPELYDRTLTMNGASKGYAMTGWRIGYAGGPDWWIAGMNKVQGQSTSNASSISQEAAEAALRGDQSFLKEWNNVFQGRRDIAVKMLNEAEGLTCRKPGGAFYVFPSCKGLLGMQTPDGAIINNDADYASYLLEKNHVGVVPGSEFGAPGYFRISYALAEEKLVEACERIQKANRALKPGR